jgi:hypothetical protein
VNEKVKEGNWFVWYLDQFNTMSPNHSKIYDEYMLDHEEHAYEFNIDTKIQETLIQRFTENPGHIILTGNAGDGKTRLCRAVYECLMLGKKLEQWPDSGIVEIVFNKGSLRIVKDLSELTDDIIERELLSLQALLLGEDKRPL